VIDLPQFLAVCLVILLGFEFLAIAARASLLDSSPARILNALGTEDGHYRHMDLVARRIELEASLHLALLLSRLFIAIIILALLPQPADPWLAVGEVLAAFLLIGISLFLLEEVVEGIASRNLDTWAPRMAPFASGLQVVFTPLLAMAMALRHQNGNGAASVSLVTEDELKSLVDAGQQGGVLEQDEREMIYSIFKLGDTLVREVMVPRIYLSALDAETSLERAVDALLESRYSRMPVYEDTVDRIIGLVYAKDLLKAWRAGEAMDTLHQVLRPAHFVPEAKRVDELLDEMQAAHVHMAIVVDEYGGVAGLVTLEDIVEEIVGEIRDEYDDDEELPFQEMGDGAFLFLGQVDINEFNAIMQADLPRDEAETLGGFIYSQIGRVPIGGESLQVNSLRLTVEQVSGRRIRKVRAERLPAGEPLQENDE
jgi:CBS domain containing-hemolysin-like protein